MNWTEEDDTSRKILNTDAPLWTDPNMTIEDRKTSKSRDAKTDVDFNDLDPDEFFDVLGK